MPLTRAIARMTLAPRDPASVGVAQPIIIALKMMTTTATMGSVPGSVLMRSINGGEGTDWTKFRLHPALTDDQRCVDDCGDNARNERRQDQGADRFFNDNRIDNEDRTWRDQ